MILLDYRNEALRLSRYYQQVAEDILWYDEENKRVSAAIHSDKVQKKWLKGETVIAGTMTRDGTSYHANLQAAARDELRYADTTLISMPAPSTELVTAGALKVATIIPNITYP